jgi:DNA modification methylase
MSFRIEEKLEWGPLATFVPNKHTPIYNWFYYKEGFSRELVLKIIEMFSIDKGWVLDPFCGVGTTNLACREKGIDSIGFDVSPLALLAAKVKCRSYNTKKLSEAFSLLKEAKFVPQNKAWIPPNIKRFFNPHTLDDVLFFAKEIEKIEDVEVREFFRLALITTTTRCSFMYKDGSVVKIRKHPVPPFRKVYFARIKRMISDLERLKTKECKTIIEWGDARKIPLENETIDFVITSPPYLNKIEYTKVYRVEEFLFFGDKKGGSYIGQRPLGDEIFEWLPLEANIYFSDMKKVLREIYRVCKKDGKVAIVVGNGCFPHMVVESDVLLAKIAEELGFSIKKIFVLNKRWCMKNRVEKVGILRESMIVMEK